MTIRQVLAEGRKRLREAQIPDWELDAWYLLEHVTGYTRNDYLLHQEEEAADDRKQQYEELIQKRSSHIPLQHLTGSQEFMGISFLVNEHVLIPRQDTEILVEESMKYIQEGMHILYMCTGSGCILLSILKLKPKVAGWGADLSECALAVAEKNRDRLNVQAEFLKSDLFSEVTGRYDCILSNPPYIPSGTVDTLMEEVRVHEPRQALDGGKDGLYYYRKIIEQSPEHLKPGGMLFFEIGYDQSEAVREQMKDFYTSITVVKDLAGLDRVVYGRLRS